MTERPRPPTVITTSCENVYVTIKIYGNTVVYYVGSTSYNVERSKSKIGPATQLSHNPIGTTSTTLVQIHEVSSQ